MNAAGRGPAAECGRIERLTFRGAEGLTLVADAAGPEDGPVVVLTHGGGQSRGAWASGMRALAAEGYRAISLDLRGHGNSDWSAGAKYRLRDYAADLGEVLRALDRPASLVGASRGGQASFLAAAAHPDRVSAVVLVDVTPRTSPDGVEAVRAFLTRSAEGFLRLEDASDLLFAFNGRPRPASAEGLARVMRRAPDGRWYWMWDPAIARPEFVGSSSDAGFLRAAAGDVVVPTLLVRAGNSELVRDSDVADFLALKPDLEIAVVPGIGHMISGDSNHLFMPPVLDFLARRNGRRAPVAADPGAGTENASAPYDGSTIRR
jgi:pimeloyl-ACP methyl ester carboxylesterase